MALEIAILFAKVTGRVLVLSPPAVLYLLHMNKKWDDNKSSVASEHIYYLFKYIMILSAYQMEDFYDFDKLRSLIAVAPFCSFMSSVTSSEPARDWRRCR